MRRLAAWCTTFVFVTACLVTVTASRSSAGVPSPEPATGAEVEALIERFLDQRLDPARTAAVESLAISRGAARFEFGPGHIAQGTVTAGGLHVAAFDGHGIFRFAPPSSFEAHELARFLHATSLDFPFRVVVLAWADSTLEELDRSLHWGAGEVPPHAAEQLGWDLRSAGDRKTHLLDWAWMQPLLSGGHSRFFHAYIVGEDDRALFFEIDPTQYEDVSLDRIPPRPFLTVGSLSSRDRVCRFGSGETRDSLAIGELRPVLAAPHTRLDCTLAPALGFSANAKLDAEVVAPGAAWLPLELHSLFTLDSLRWDGETPAGVFRAEGSSLLWFRLANPPAPGERHELRLSYHGSLLEGVGDWLLPRTWSEWYPQPWSWNESTFDLTFHSPTEFLLTSTGEPDSSATTGNVRTTHWSMRRPTHNATFVIGRFVDKAFGSDAIPPVHGLFYDGKPTRIRWTGLSVAGQAATMDEGERMEEWVPADAAKCVEFYQGLLGPAQVPQFVVTEIPSLRGEAFPGLINIPQTTYNGPNAVAEDLVFRAHEVAHQWWGYTLNGRDYHEHWLSEGFANFYALLYLQKGLGHGADYLKILAAWRQQLLDDRDVRPEHGRQAGPMWLGTRNATDDRPGDFGMIDYLKGAWVLHMLRSLTVDVNTMDDSRFMATMQDFFRTYAGGHATTADFRRVVERDTGLDLGWFFDEWVYGNEIPSYQFSYHCERTPAGKYAVTCRVHRKDSKAPFKTPVILRVDFGKERYAWVRRMLESPDTEFQLPLLDEAPVGVVFNDIESLLCRSETVEWK